MFFLATKSKQEPGAARSTLGYPIGKSNRLKNDEYTLALVGKTGRLGKKKKREKRREGGKEGKGEKEGKREKGGGGEKRGKGKKKGRAD